MQHLTVALCFTESSLNYDVKHYGNFDISTSGICGLKSIYWIDEIEEITHENINSLYAGSKVLEHLLIKYDNDLFKALKHFKGANKNQKPVEKVIKIYEEMKQKKLKITNF